MSTIIIGDRVVQSGDSGYQPQGVNRPTQQQQNQYQQMAQGMADAGIRSLSGRTTSTPQGAEARDIQRDFLADKTGPGGGTTPVEDFMLDPLDFSASPGIRDRLMETKGDPLKRSIVSNILRGKPPRETGIFGLDTSNLGLPTINPALGFIQGLGNTNAVLKKLSEGSELNSKDKITLVNLRNNLAGDDLTNLIVKYAKDNKVKSNDLFANFNEEYSKIEESVEDVNPSMNQFFDRMDDMSFAETAEAMAKNLTGTRDAYDTIPPNYLENITDRLGTEGLQFLKVTNPQAYYRLRPNDPDLANESFVSTGDKVADRRFNAKIMEARAEAMNRQSRQDANMAQASPAFAPPTAPAPGTPAPPPPTYPGFPGTPTPGLPPGTPTVPTTTVATNYSNLPTYTQLGIPTFLGDPRFAQFRDTLNLFPRV